MDLVIKMSLWFKDCFGNFRLKLSFTQGECRWVNGYSGRMAENDLLYLMGPLV